MDRHALGPGDADEVGGGRALEVEETAPQPGLTAHPAEGAGVVGHVVHRQDVQGDRHPVGRVLAELGYQERSLQAELGEHEGVLGAGSGVVDLIAVRQGGGGLGEESLVVSTCHEHVDVVVPGDEALVTDRPDHGAAVDGVGDVEAAAGVVEVLEHLQEQGMNTPQQLRVVQQRFRHGLTLLSSLSHGCVGHPRNPQAIVPYREHQSNADPD